ncbi:MAG: hypothetical protein ABIW96_06035, partial [Polaromonas sp.]
TLLAEGVSCVTDYTKNSGRIATHFKHAKQARIAAAGLATPKKNALEDAGAADKDAVPELAPDELKTVGDALARCAVGRLEDGCDSFLDPRLRQLLIPCVDAAGTIIYRAITPLTAGGLCQVVRAEMLASNEANKEARKSRKPDAPPVPTRSIQSAQFGIGGANPQNVGGLVREMQQPMYMRAPQAIGDIRQALAIHHKGVQLKVPFDLVRKYADFLEDNTQDGVRQTGMESREEEKTILSQFVLSVSGQADEIKGLLDLHLDALPKDASGQPMYFTGKLHRDVGAAWVIESLRDRDWKSLAAAWLANAIGKFEVRTKDGPKRLLILDAYGIKSIANLIEEILS